MNIDARIDAAEAARYRLVRTDSYADIALGPGGAVVWADETTGNYAVRAKDGSVSEHSLGAKGLRIIPR